MLHSSPPPPLHSLNLNVPSSRWMEPPSKSHLQTASDLPDSILLHPIDNIPPSVMTKLTKKNPPLFQIIFIQDLKQYNFIQVCLGSTLVFPITSKET
ncbi:uncharacterized protein VP01_1008g4 [Puccinia sorghi]|uniref:Uncharacterized protein n=1 Tax=Puccinia sorghi TaxID=27349 RepID=A0A0L6VVD1_9BASI|nr:uncharacterized protein VP01_1008g4 [Puccinia sorghi]